MKKFNLVLIAFLIFSLTSCINSKNRNEITLNVIEFNDLHGHIEQDSNNAGGLSNASYLINNIRNEDDLDNTILIANGDMFQETALSRESYGRVVIECMNEMKFDAMGIGNHEFDWGFDKISNYFDGNASNGEANFPLLNANIYEKKTQKLYSIENGNILSSTMVTKEDVKVGIISYIGDVYNSINANMVSDFEFKSSNSQIVSSVNSIASQLKIDGANIVIVSIHGGNSKGIDQYQVNQDIALLKNDNGYLVDAVINGHTHTTQLGSIKRENGTAMPVIQSSEYNKNSSLMDKIGRIDLTYNYKEKKVTQYSLNHIEVSTAGNKYDQKVQSIIDSYYDSSKEILEEIYCENKYSFTTSDTNLQHYAANLMMTSTAATAAVCNTGAFRNSVSSGNFDFTTLYALNPFDNHIILCEISGLNLANFMNSNASYEFCYTKDNQNIATDQTYQLAIIDYVYFSNYFSSYRDSIYVDTNLQLRELFTLDLRLRTKEGFNIYNAYNSIKIKKLI